MSKSDSHISKTAGSFLPAEYVKGKGQVRASLMAMLLFVLVLGGVVGAFVVNHQRWRKVHLEQTAVEAAFHDEASKIEQLKALEKQRNELLERAEIVTALKDRVPRSVLVGEIVRGIPDGVTLTRIDLEGERVKPPAPKEEPKKKSAKGSLTKKGIGSGKDEEKDKEPEKVLPPKFTFSMSIAGVSSNNDEIADFLKSLNASELFRDVELQYSDNATIDKREYRKFSITLRLAPKADAKMLAETEDVRIRKSGFGIAGEKTVTD